jgi:hypothetical protein
MVLCRSEAKMVSIEEQKQIVEYETESDSSAEITLEGKYRCRQCGKIFGTPEEHKEHIRKRHDLPIFQPIAGMAL